MKTQELDRAREVKAANRKALAVEILRDMAYQFHRGEKADYQYIAGRVAMLASIPWPYLAWAKACEDAGAQVDEDDADAEAAAEGDDYER